MSTTLSACRSSVLQFSCLVLGGAFDAAGDAGGGGGGQYTGGIPYSPMTRPMLEQTLPGGYLVELVAHAASDAETFKNVRRFQRHL